MALKYIAGTLPRIGVYTLVLGTLSRLPSGSWDLNADTVASVDVVGAGKQYNYAAGGAGIVAGGIVAGPLGALVGGLAPKAFKDDVVQFVIRFRNGDVAHFSGSPAEYRRALNASYKGHRSAAAPSAPAPPAPAPAPAAAESLSSTQLSEIERLRAEVDALRQQQESKPLREAEHPPITPPAPQRTLAEVQDEMAAEREDRAEALDGHSRLWFAGVAERRHIPAPPNEAASEKKQREAQNEQFRKEYKKALQVVRKQHEKEIQHNQRLKFREKMGLLNEMNREFTYRTSK